MGAAGRLTSATMTASKPPSRRPWLRNAALAAALGACGSTPEAPLPPADAPGAALPAAEPGWGAVFWREGKAFKTGGGSILVGPRGVALTTLGGRGACGEEAVGAPPHAALAPPSAVAAPEAPAEPPALPSALVETANWRLDALLPPPDPYTPASPDAAPGRQRGLVMGSLIKVRRFGGPPVLLASGVRDCTGVIAILDATAANVLDHESLPGFCAAARLLPPADLDGDKARETAIFNEARVVAYRLLEAPGTVTLQPLGDWRCDAGG